ncbi:Hypothetical predicted protein [Pelobates cultripes]|uniref:Uncharacterized protein n=1 Tax=Pelobates cultripes TaxID=61616 RepID=A0AAD1SWW8_PELCU|nr:Hypothetical predicted protein [Pelobates cultripes]
MTSDPSETSSESESELDESDRAFALFQIRTAFARWVALLRGSTTSSIYNLSVKLFLEVIFAHGSIQERVELFRVNLLLGRFLYPTRNGRTRGNSGSAVSAGLSRGIRSSSLHIRGILHSGQHKLIC